MDNQFVIIALILFTAAFIQGFSGFGFAIVSIPLLVFLIGVKAAIPLAALLGLVINIYLIIKLHQHINISELKNVLIGAVIGIPFGVYFLANTDAGAIETFLGVLILAFAIVSLIGKFQPKSINPNWGYGFGLVAGVLGGAFNTNGPPVLIYFYLSGFDKFKQKASITGFFLVNSVMIVIWHAVSGLTNSAILLDFAYYLPFVVAGFVIGDHFFGKVSPELFNKIILIGLVIMGIFLVIR